MLTVPVVFTESASREDARAELKQFEDSTRTDRLVKILDSSSPVREEELYIQLSKAETLRQTDETNPWQEALQQMVHEWDKEVDDRLQRWVVGQYKGVIYLVSPNVVLPAAFYLGAAVGLRRRLKIYQRNNPGDYHLAIDLSENPRILLEPPAQDISQIRTVPEGATPPGTRRGQLILHLIISDRHEPQLEAHPEHVSADSVALFYPKALPMGADWLPYVQAFVQRAKPWVERYQQVDMCLSVPNSVAMALGMAFSRSPQIRVCHWYAGVYKPVAALSWIEQRLPFD